MGNVFQLSNCFKRLGDVHVHLVAIKIGIVRSADRKIQPESVKRQDFDSVTHHTHSVQGRLTVE